MIRFLGCLLLVCTPALASELVRAEFTTNLASKPVPYAVLLPDGYKDGPPLPLLVYLHYGGGDREALTQVRDLFEREWKAGRLPRMVVATPSTSPASFFVDQRDGSEKWESMIVGPFRAYIQKTYNASSDAKKNVMMGGSMGGEGTLRIGLKHPTEFLAIAALEPGLEPVLHWKDMKRSMYYWIEDADMEAAFGKPIDAAYWEANNPASVVAANPNRILDSGLQIYLDVGDNDVLRLYRGVEFFHRVLWDAGVKHEYHIVHGGDHVGRTRPARTTEALEFLGRALNPPGPDSDAEGFRKLMAPKIQKYGVQ